jgi:ATP-dependent 26S proteasome regulatory subunit
MTNKQAKLDIRWIEQGLSKLDAHYANVVFFETDDPVRHDQFQSHFLTVRPKHKILRYDRWNGLMRYERDASRYTAVSAGEGDRFAVQVAEKTGMDKAFLDLGAALRHADKELKKGACCLILRHLDGATESAQDRDPQLIQAIRAWSQDPEVSLKGSCVICLAAQADSWADPFTLQGCAVVPVDLAEDQERAHEIWSIQRQYERRSEPYDLGLLARLTAGLNLHQLRSVLLETYHRHDRLESATVAALKNEFIGRESLVEIVRPSRGFEAIGGYEEVKRFINDNIIRPLRETDLASRWGTTLPRGAILYGPPGTGKTVFSKALAKETGLPFINMQTENLYSQYLGQSGRLFARALKIAEKNAPAIIFIDEIDRFGRRGSTTSDGASEETRRVYNQVLEYLGDQDRKTILVGTTNRIEDLDEAFLRPGRIDYKVHIGLPDEKARRAILKLHLSEPPLPVDSSSFLDERIGDMIPKTEGLSGAELEEIAHRVRRNGFIRKAQCSVTEDFFLALSQVWENKNGPSR